MLIREVMTRDVKIASPDDAIQTAARTMSEHDFGSLPVGQDDRLVGMLTDRDIVIRGVALWQSLQDCKVHHVMSPAVRYVFDDESVQDTASMMADLQLRRLPVLDRDKRLVGIVSLGDLAVAKPQSAGDALRSIVEAPADATA